MPQNNQLISISDWVEIYRTTDEWESKLVQTTLANQHIRCRPTYDRGSDGERQIVLSVSHEDQVESMELVSNIDLVIAEDYSSSRAGIRAASWTRTVWDSRRKSMGGVYRS